MIFKVLIYVKKILTGNAQYDIILITYMSEKTVACVRNHALNPVRRELSF